MGDDASLHEPLVSAIIAESERCGLRGPLNTIYLGGGTPALLSAAHMSRLLGAFAARCSWSSTAELTLEANPSNVTRESLHEWTSLGINRLSIGVQTFNDAVLTRLGRRHDAADSQRALRLVNDHWPSTWSADLLMGWHDQQAVDVLRDLRMLEGHSPPHVSVYGLTVEPATTLASHQARGKRVVIPAQRQARFDGIWSEWLGERAYERYEISNFSRTGHRSRHNQVYWSNRSYVGLGPGAASSVHPLRWTNRPDVAGYIAAAARRHDVRCSVERVAPLPRLLESLSIGLRQREGLALAELDARFSPAWRSLLADSEAEPLMGNILIARAGRLSLHPDSFIKVDAITSELVTRFTSIDGDHDARAGASSREVLRS